MSNNQGSVLREQQGISGSRIPGQFLVIAIVVMLINLSAGQAIAQKRPKPTPTPAAGSQIETGASRTTPDQATTANGGGKADKSNGLLQVQSGPGGGGLSEPPGAGRITKIIITVVTGGDDLRDGSAVRPFLITRDDKRITSNYRVT